MDPNGMLRSLCRGYAASRFCSRHRLQPSARRAYASIADSDQAREPIAAAKPFQFPETNSRRSDSSRHDADKVDPKVLELLNRVRVVPASRSYFSSNPTFTDDMLHLEALLRKTQLLPTMPADEAPKIAWKTLPQYKLTNRESVKVARYRKIVKILQRLNLIHRSLMPREVDQAIRKYMRIVQPSDNKPKLLVIDQWGRSRAVGRRKASSAVAFVVEGDGSVMINGKSLNDAFGRLHDRESAIWPLKVTNRVDKYNIWAFVKGGGTTGQAEALMLGVAKALLVHEPALKPALRRAGCITRDMRRVERKKPGKLKARKMPAWVKR